MIDEVEDRWFLLGILNSSLIDFLWRRISKPFRGNFFAANKQFIAPLPIARRRDSEEPAIVEEAKKLHDLHTNRRDLIDQVERRLHSPQTTDDERDLSWLWGEKCAWRSWTEESPFDGRSAERTVWCKAKRDEFLDERYSKLQHFLNNQREIEVEARHGEVVLSVGETPVIDGVFAEEDAEWVAAQWRHQLRKIGATSVPDARRLVGRLLRLRDTDNEGLRTRVLDLDAELSELEREILQVEEQTDDLVYDLYDLSDDERAMVEGDKRSVI